MRKKTPELSLGTLASDIRKDETPAKDTTNLVTRMVNANELSKDPEVVKELYKYGKVPVAYCPTKAMVRKPAATGLKYLIGQATTVVEVNNLLNRGKTEYKNATQDTIRKWEKSATKRISQLTPATKQRKKSKS